MRSPTWFFCRPGFRTAYASDAFGAPASGIRRAISLLAALMLGTAAIAAAPANDNFANATALAPGGGTVMATNAEATLQTGEPQHAFFTGGHSVWWKWTATSIASVTVDTIGSNFDTLLGIYTGSSVDALTIVNYDDESGGDHTSKTLFSAVPGTTYYIAVDGYDGATGNITLTLSVGGPPPTNDPFSSAVVVPTGGGDVVGTNVDATKEVGEPNHAGMDGGRSVWWSWTPSASGNATITTTGSNFDTLLAVYLGTSVGSLTEVAADDDEDDGTKTSTVTFSAVNGTNYRIAVDGFLGVAGSIKLSVQFTTIVGPANDNFADATVIPAGGGTVTGNNFNSTAELGEPRHDDKLGGRSVWWSWTPASSGPVSIVTAGSSFDTLLAVYTGAVVTSLTNVASNDDDGISTTSRVDFPAVAGTTYKIAVDGFKGETGSISLTIDAVIAPPGPVVALAPSAINSTSFVANWNLVSGATGYRIDVSTSNSFATFLPGYEDLNVGNVTNRSVAGLTAGTTYYYRVRAYNSAGTGPSSSSVPVATNSAPFQGLTNLSVRANSGSGEDTLILGFAIAGAGDKTLIIRGVGPKLVDYGVPVHVEDPSIVLYSGGTVINQNNDWSTELTGDFVTVGAFALDAGSLDSAMKVTLGPGNYTVHMVNPGTPAAGLIEVYDLSKGSTSQLANLSCRLGISAGQTIIVGANLDNETKPLLVRSVGPSLAPYLLDPASALQDPDLRIYVGPNEVGYNDDWDSALSTYFGAAGAFPLSSGSKDAVLRPTVTPGGFTVHTTGKGGAGVVLMEIYH